MLIARIIVIAGLYDSCVSVCLDLCLPVKLCALALLQERSTSAQIPLLFYTMLSLSALAITGRWRVCLDLAILGVEINRCTTSFIPFALLTYGRR